MQPKIVNLSFEFGHKKSFNSNNLTGYQILTNYKKNKSLDNVDYVLKKPALMNDFIEMFKKLNYDYLNAKDISVMSSISKI